MWRYLLVCLLGMWLFVSSALSTDYVLVVNDTVEFEPNTDGILPCHVEPEKDLSLDFVNWHLTLKDHDDKVVYIYRRGQVMSTDVHNDFKNRTEIVEEHLKHGNISIKLVNVTEEDNGNYTCAVTINKTKAIEKSIRLIVTPQADSRHIEAPSPPPWSPPPHVGWIVGVVVGSLLVLAFIMSFIVYNKNTLFRCGAAAPPQQSPGDDHNDTELQQQEPMLD